jgi:acyl carrier protein
MLELRVKKVLSQVLNIPTEEITENTSPDTEKKWDSLGHMNLVIALEDEFGINFTEQQIIEMLNYPLILCVVKETIQTNHTLTA